MRRLAIGLLCLFAMSCWNHGSYAQRNTPVVKPNYRQAAQYSTRYLRQFMYDTSVRPRWIGETDEFWYSFRTSKGTDYYRVDPNKGTKEPLFDSVKLAALLTETIRKPFDPARLSLSRAELNDEGTELTFVIERVKYKFDLAAETLEKLGEPEEETERSRESFNSREEYFEYLRERRRQQGDEGEQAEDRSERKTDPNAHRSFSPDRKSYVFAKGHDLYFVAIPEDYEPPTEDETADDEEDESESGEDTDQGDGDQEQNNRDEQDEGGDEVKKDEEDVKDEKDDEKVDDESVATEQQDEQQQEQKQQENEQQEQDENEQQKDEEQQQKQEDQEDDQEQQQQEEQQQQDEEQDEEQDQQDQQDDDDETEKDESGEADSDEEKEIPIPKIGLELDDTAVRLSDDGAADFSFAGRPTGSRSRNFRLADIKDDQKTKPNVTWSKDSQKFYISRRDARGVKELWVINSLADPRPTLESYPYPMPGEEHIRTSELYYCDLANKDLVRVEPKWTDEGYTNTHWTDDSKELRFIRRDRLLRNIEFCRLPLDTGEAQCLIAEGFENTNISPQSVRYIEETGEMIWWSERSGWGHFYLYDADGNLKNAITSGEFRASRIVDVEEENRLLYFTASGREPGENIYQSHLYRVRFDGGGLTLMDPGDASHSSRLSPSKQFVVDNCSRVDMAPVSILRDAHGNDLMQLEQADLSRLEQLGWRMPETFVVKAADGVTDLYGNMWKPFDFDPKKRYPIIAHVYPGPQTEGTRHTFSATAGEQQLAQLGFIVIQVGHRGGTPGRSKAYAAHGYFNLRDYGLADKKAAIEQLAQRFPFVDIDRIGIYGHSGGGFMTAAALLREPYNDFFKVGVATAGNHDNNIYNNSWSERYHGLKVVEVEEEQSEGRRRGRGGRGNRERRQQMQENQRDAFHVEATDYFYEYEMLNHQDASDLDHWDESAWWDNPDLYLQDDQQEEQKQEEQQEQKEQDQDEQVKQTQETDQEEQKQEDNTEENKEDSDSEVDEEKQDDTQQDDTQQDDTQQDDTQQDDTQQDEQEESDDQKKTRFEIEVPANTELAGNLKGHLFLIHGELDNNVHPANTLRLVDALIKANKRFDMLYLPATRHGFGEYQPYVTQRMYEYFAEHLLDDYQSSADISEKE